MEARAGLAVAARLLIFLRLNGKLNLNHGKPTETSTEEGIFPTEFPCARAFSPQVDPAICSLQDPPGKIGIGLESLNEGPV